MSNGVERGTKPALLLHAYLLNRLFRDCSRTAERQKPCLCSGVPASTR
jgi:hypothetical protein